MHQYFIQPSEAEEILGTLTIIHPYGTVGPLPTATKPNGIPYGGFGDPGSKFDFGNYSNLSELIKTYTERVEEETVLKSIQKEVAQAERIVFLGFGFHDQNLEMLTPSILLQKEIPIYGTAFQMSESDIDVVKSQLHSFYSEEALEEMRGGVSVILHDEIELNSRLGCSELFDHYGKSFRRAAVVGD